MEINKDHLPELLQRLNEIKAVMQQVHKNKKRLLMSTWFYHDDCGTVACIMGHVALNANNKLSEVDTGREARNQAEELDLLTASVFFSNQLSYSIWKPFYYDRKEYAWRTGLFSGEEVNTLRHLTEKEPTALDVVNYLDAIITKLEAIE